MTIQFSKYQGTGNDFVLIDNRQLGLTTVHAAKLAVEICDRRFGVGADGLMLITDHAGLNYQMDFYNPDGSQSLCGNGSRCAAMFARHLGLVAQNEKAKFKAIDGIHKIEIQTNGWVSFEVFDIKRPSTIGNEAFIHNGSPHHIVFAQDVSQIDVVGQGRAIRYADQYKPSGTNVNFVSVDQASNQIMVRTYERGVENETLSCGTGVTASAIASAAKFEMKSPITIHTKGGELQVIFEQHADLYTNIYLIGPAVHVFDGNWPY